jgi:hypothetical protein
MHPPESSFALLGRDPIGKHTLRGIFELREPIDLFRKLQHDFTRIQLNALDQYAAFDFFVTAEHILDWLFPGRENDKARNEAREKNFIRGVCSHIASGAKHFEVQHSRHASVTDVAVVSGAFQDGAFQSSAFSTSRLIVRLDGDAADNLGDVVECLFLAGLVIKHWESHFVVTAA